MYEIATIKSPQETTALSSESPQAPWLTNKQLLCPLLVEYDHTIAELNSQLSTYRTELSLLSSQVQEVTEENTKLHSELRKNMESHLKTAPATSNSLSHSGAEGNVMVEALQRQTDVLSQERDSYIDLLRQASKNLEAVQKSERVNSSTNSFVCELLKKLNCLKVQKNSKAKKAKKFKIEGLNKLRSCMTVLVCTTLHSIILSIL